MTYLQFLSWLTSLGPKLPQAIAFLQQIFDGVNGLVGLFATRAAKKSAKAFKPTAKELASEKAIAANMKTRGIMDGKLATILRQAYAFIKANPELWAVLLKLIGV